MTRCRSRKDMAMAYSATAVLPAEVWAETRTDSLRSKHAMETCWKGSSVKGYDFAMGPLWRGLERVPWSSESLLET